MYIGVNQSYEYFIWIYRPLTVLLLKYYFSVLCYQKFYCCVTTVYSIQYKILVEMILIPDIKIPREEQIANVLTHGV